MVDIVRKQGTGVPQDMYSRWRDMGDGTHALERYVQGEVEIPGGVAINGPIRIDGQPIGISGAVQFVDQNGVPYGVKHVGNKPRVSAMPYLFDIAERNIPDHEAIRLIGYNGDVDATTECLRTAGGPYVPPAAELQMEVYSSSASDAGVVIKTGTSDSITYVASVDDSIILTLTDAGVDFTAATAVVAGDAILLDGDGIQATVLTVAATVLTARSWSSDLPTTALQAYRVVDLSGGGTGVQVVMFHYLDADYVPHTAFLVPNGTTVVTTAATDIYRVNRLHAVVCGTGLAAAGQIDLRHLTDTPVYRTIPIGGNTDTDAFYTVPTGKTVYLVGWHGSSGFTTANRLTRWWLRATADNHGHNAGTEFHLKDVAMTQDANFDAEFRVPLRCPARTDIKIDVACSETNAIAAGAVEGWIE